MVHMIWPILHETFNQAKKSFKGWIQIWKSKQLAIKSKSTPNTTKNKMPKDLSGKKLISFMKTNSFYEIHVLWRMFDNFLKFNLAVNSQESITCQKELTHWMLNAILLLMVSCSSLVSVNNYCQQFQDP